jgi:hypothetical protein
MIDDLTADTITDAHIRNLRASADAADLEVERVTRYALSKGLLQLDAAVWRKARERCAEILNARGAR